MSVGASITAFRVLCEYPFVLLSIARCWVQVLFRYDWEGVVALHASGRMTERKCVLLSN